MERRTGRMEEKRDGVGCIPEASEAKPPANKCRAPFRGCEKGRPHTLRKSVTWWYTRNKQPRVVILSQLEVECP